MSVSIGIGGDFVPTKSNLELFKNSDRTALIGHELEKVLLDHDFLVFNLEAPITDLISPIDKCGPNLSIPTSAMPGIKKINPCFFTLANNHIKDQGEGGIRSTIGILQKNGIEYAGVGENLIDIKKAFVKEINNLKIGIYCCCEHEFSCATENSPGANPFDPYFSFDDVSTLREKVDFLIVLYHGGRENYRYPTPNLKKTFKKFVDKGADLVIGQHSHCISSCETYKGKMLMYGQGNFIFDASERNEWQTSLFISINIIGAHKYVVNFVPIVKKENVIRKASEDERKEILSCFKKRNTETLDDKIIEEKFDDLCQENMVNYLRALRGNISIFEKAFIKLTNPGFKFFYNKNNKLTCKNFVDCETHLELLRRIISRG